MLGRITFLGGSFCLGAAVIKKADDNKPSQQQEQKDDYSHFICKPSELPLYTPLHELNKTKKIDHHVEHKPSALEDGIRAIRIEVTKAFDALENQKKSLNDTIETGKAHTKFIVDYLNEPDNTVPRIGAVAIGGLSGFIFALRGGFIRKLLYTGIGAGGMASICYPKEAGKYAQETLIEAKKIANIGYNFVVGVKPGDDGNVSKSTKVPTSIAELKDSLSDLAQSAKDAIFPSKK